jgi:hypothetical protein
MRKKVGEVRGTIPAGGEVVLAFTAQRPTSVSAFAAKGGFLSAYVGIRSILTGTIENVVDTRRERAIATAALFDPVESDLVIYLERLAPGVNMTITLVNDGASAAEGTLELWGADQRMPCLRGNLVTLIRTPDDDERRRSRRDVEWLRLALLVLVLLTVAHVVFQWVAKPSPVFDGGARE